MAVLRRDDDLNGRFFGFSEATPVCLKNAHTVSVFLSGTGFNDISQISPDRRDLNGSHSGMLIEMSCAEN